LKTIEQLINKMKIKLKTKKVKTNPNSLRGSHFKKGFDTLSLDRVMARRAGIYRIPGFNCKLTNAKSFEDKNCFTFSFVSKRKYFKTKTSLNNNKTKDLSKEIMDKVLKVVENKVNLINNSFDNKSNIKSISKRKQSFDENSDCVKRKSICVESKVKDLKISKVKEGQVLDRIISVFQNKGKLCHLIKWKGSDECDVCDSYDINKKWPQVVIKYYQKNLHFQ
jgi:hypothetical protein